MRTITILIFGLLLFVAGPGCKPSTDLVEIKDDAGNLLEAFHVRKGTPLKEGPYKAYYPTGELFIEANYVNDTLQGERRLYYQSGQLQTKEPYRNGQFDGIFEAYHENGELELRGEYVDNAMQGEWKGYYDNGQLKEVVQFTDNQENGPFIEYHPNGNLKAEGSYLNGDTEHGLLKEYNEEGVLVRKADCEKGICRTIWRLEDDEETEISSEN